MPTTPDQRAACTFGIARLLLAVAIFAVAFQIVRPLGLFGVPVGFFMAIPMSSLLLVARRQHTRAIVRSLVFCGLGALGGFMFCPSIHPPYEPGDEYRYMIAGVIIAWVIGVATTKSLPLVFRPRSVSADPPE